MNETELRFCVDCRYCYIETNGAFEFPARCVSPNCPRDFVYKTPQYAFCDNKNRDGKCKDYEPRPAPVKRPWWKWGKS